MGSMVAGTMHAPLTAIRIVFDFSDTYQVIPPIMFAAVSSAVVEKIFMKQSIYTFPLEREGIEIGYGINLSIVHRIGAGLVMRKKFTRVKAGTPVRELIELVEEKDQTVFPVVDQHDVCVGLVRFQDLRPVFRDPASHDGLKANDIMVKTMPLLIGQDSLGTVLKTFELSDLDTLPVVADQKSKRLIGILRHKDALRRYRKEILLRSEQ
jgi:CIC family chloride channel protein